MNIIYGVGGIIIGALISGIFNIITHCQDNCNQKVLNKKEQEHKINLEIYSRLEKVMKEAIDAAIDLMHATWHTTWVRNAINQTDPTYQQAILNALHNWGRTWKASAELRMYLDDSTVRKYDELIMDLQTLKIEDLLFVTLDGKTKKKNEEVTLPIRTKVEEIFKSYKEHTKLSP